MKNITVSIDDETYRQSRIEAVEAGASVSALVRAYLQQLIGSGSHLQQRISSPVSDEEFERLLRLQDEVLEDIRASGRQFSGADNLPREALYGRDALR